MRAQGDGLGVADLHIHTSLSDGMADIPDLLSYVEQETRLDVIAITDHDDIEGGLQARELVSRGDYRFQVVVGAEVTTLEGHLLALFLEEPVPSFLSLEQTIVAVHAQGGLCVVPHPMSWLTRSIGQGSLDKIARNRQPDIFLDGIEIVNPTIAGRVRDHQARQLNERRYKLAETGGSDAHFLAAIGTGYTLFPGRSAEDLRHSLKERTCRAGGTQMDLGKIGYNQIAQQQWRSLVVAPMRTLRRMVQRMMP